MSRCAGHAADWRVWDAARKEAARSCVAHGAAWEEDGDGERDLGAAVNGLVCHGISGEKKIKLTIGHWMHVRWSGGLRRGPKKFT